MAVKMEMKSVINENMRIKKTPGFPFLHIKYLIFSNTIDDELTMIVYHMVFLLVALRQTIRVDLGSPLTFILTPFVRKIRRQVLVNTWNKKSITFQFIFDYESYH